MRAPRDIIKHVATDTAKRKRRCHRNQEHQIAAGDTCIVVKDGAFRGAKNYCVICAPDILDAAQVKLESLRAELGVVGSG
jgi:hypothetical protein